MTTRDTSETSVTFSLAELAKMEHERVVAEEAERARAKDRTTREARDAEAKKRAAEAAEIAAEAEARARRLRAEAEEKARIEARERASADVARIEAQAKAKLEADNAARAHELAILRARTESGKKRLSIALAAVIAVAVSGGAAGAHSFSQKVAGLTAETERLREGQHALAEEREQAKSTQLTALDKRLAVLRARKMDGAEEARASAEAARNAIDRKTLDLDRLRAFGDALDALQARLDTLDKLALLDRRMVDLAVLAGDKKHAEAVTAARAAAQRARSMGNDDGIAAYQTALEKLRDAIAHGAAGGRPVVKPQETPGTCLDGDPCCANGRRIC